jgi:hypothetical protein
LISCAAAAVRCLSCAWQAGGRQAIDMLECYAILKKTALRIPDVIMLIIETY